MGGGGWRRVWRRSSRSKYRVSCFINEYLANLCNKASWTVKPASCSTQTLPVHRRHPQCARAGRGGPARRCAAARSLLTSSRFQFSELRVQLHSAHNSARPSAAGRASRARLPWAAHGPSALHWVGVQPRRRVSSLVPTVQAHVTARRELGRIDENTMILKPR